MLAFDRRFRPEKDVLEEWLNEQLRKEQAAVANEGTANDFTHTLPNGPRRANVNNPAVQLFGIPGIPGIPDIPFIPDIPGLPDLPSLPILDDIRRFLGLPSIPDLLNFLNPQPGESEECKEAKAN
jgi:hypothetical protein